MCGGSKKDAKQQCCITFDDEGQCFGIVICERQCGCFPCKICAKDEDRVMKIALRRAFLDTFYCMAQACIPYHFQGLSMIFML